MTGAALAVTSVIAFFASGEVLLAHPNQQVDCQGPADCARRFRGRGGGDRRVSGWKGGTSRLSTTWRWCLASRPARSTRYGSGSSS